MLGTLHSRLILSHTLPVMIVVPLMGILLIHLQAQALIGDLSDELTDQAQMAAVIAGENPSLWEDPSQARQFVNHLGEPLDTYITLFDSTGKILASTHPDTTPFDLTELLSGKTQVLQISTVDARRQAGDVLVPVVTDDGRVIGALRLTHQLPQVIEQFRRLRILVGSVLGGGLFIGALVGWTLGVTLQQPIARLKGALETMTDSPASLPLPEDGPQELRALTATYNSLTDRLCTLETERRRLLANLVHEIGRPLGALVAAIQALMSGAVDEPALRDELLRGMHGEVNRLRRLLDDLSRLYDRTVGELQLTLKPINPNKWLPALLAPWREAARAKGLTWQAKLSPKLPAIVADPDRLAQVIGNLLSNAIKYTQKGGAVRIDVHVDEDALLVRVSDTGPGIVPEAWEFIFTPFYRAPTRRRFPQGMGLGLSIARDIALAHGGTLEIERSSSEGTQFALRLPLADSAET